MAGFPEDLLTAETIEKNSLAFLAGGGLILYVSLRVLKSGFLVFGDKATLMVEKAKLEIRLEQALKDNAELTKKLAALENRQAPET